MPDPSAALELTIPQLLHDRASARPNALALSARSIAGFRDRLTYAQLVARMEAMAGAFSALGLSQNDRIGVFLGNEAGRECMLTALGALRLEAVVVPLNTRSGDEDLRHALDLVAPAAVVTTAAGATRISGLRPGTRLLVCGDSNQAPAQAQLWPEPTAAAWDAVPPPEMPDPDRVGCLLFTSGTTARSKAVMHSHRTMIGAGLCCGAALNLREGDLYQGGWPFFTSSALNLGALSCWVHGAGLVFEEPLDNAGRLRLIANEGTTFYHGVPSVVHFLMEEYAQRPVDVSRLRRVGYGGAAMPPDLIRRLDKHWPHTEQVQIYGQTESGPVGTHLKPADLWRKLGSVGEPMPYCEIVIVDDDAQPVPPGTIGEILIRGPGVALGYFRNPKASGETFVCGGVRTGDVGHLDEDGFLFFTDRRKDVINRGGLKVASVAVEEVLYRYPAIREAAVVALPHPALGEDVAAWLVIREGATLELEDLSAFCARSLADYARPRHYFIVDELPKNPMGKVLKSELRQRHVATRV